MIKRCGFLGLFLITILLTGCGEKKNLNEDINNSNNAKTEGSTKEAESTNKEEPVGIRITEASSFFEEYATVKLEDGKSYLIDTTGTVKNCDVSENGTKQNTIIFFDEVASQGNNLVNVDGDILMSPEQGGYTGLLTSYIDGYAIAYYFEEAYPDSIVKLGVLNGKGEFIVPLQEEHPILTYFTEIAEKDHDILPHKYNNVDVFSSISKAPIMNTANIADDGRIMGSTFYSLCHSGTHPLQFKYLGDGTFYVLTPNSVFHYDVNENVCIEDPDGRDWNTAGFPANMQYEDGYYGEILTNDSGNTYFTIIDNSGNQMFEPFKGENLECIYVNKDGFILKSEDQYGYYGLNGIQKYTFDDVKSMESLCEGLLLVEGIDGFFRYIDITGKTVIDRIKVS